MLPVKDLDVAIMQRLARDCNNADMRIAELEAALRDVRQAIIDMAPDTLWLDLIQTAVDRIDGVLQPVQ